MSSLKFILIYVEALTATVMAFGDGEVIKIRGDLMMRLVSLLEETRELAAASHPPTIPTPSPSYQDILRRRPTRELSSKSQIQPHDLGLLSV